MRRLNGWVLAGLVVAGCMAPATAWSSTGGNANAGDVWIDNVGQPSGPGHEMDPHLACQDINLWGSGLADGSGTFTIDGWAPSGSQEIDYGPSTWSYNLSHGTQVVAVIDVHALISAAVRNGDVPLRTQGYHFKLQFSQDPHKHKTFWVQCPAPSTPPSGPPSSPPQSPPPPPATPPTTPVTTVSPPPAPGVPAVTPAPKPQKHAKAHKRRPHHRARHRRPRQVGRRHVPRPTFTG